MLYNRKDVINKLEVDTEGVFWRSTLSFYGGSCNPDCCLIDPPILETPPWELKPSLSLYNTNGGPPLSPLYYLRDSTGGGGGMPPPFINQQSGLLVLLHSLLPS